VVGLLQNLTKQQEAMMATLTETLAAVTDEDTKVDSIIALVGGLQSQVNAVLAGNLPPALQAQVNAVFDQAKASGAKIDTALNANVPA
jgi:ABC-type transporter Mla subunit MlaD